MMLSGMPTKGLRRNDDAMKNNSWYQKKYSSIEKASLNI